MGRGGARNLSLTECMGLNPMKVDYDVQARTDGLARKGRFRKELEPCERKPSCTVPRGKGFVRIRTSR